MQTQRRCRGEKAIKDRDRGLDLCPKPRTVQSHQKLKEAEQESPLNLQERTALRTPSFPDSGLQNWREYISHLPPSLRQFVMAAPGNQCSLQTSG